MKKNAVIMPVILLVLAVSCASSGGGAKTVETFPNAKYFWDFSSPAAGTAGWVISEDSWDFHGTTSLSRDDKTFKKGMLRWDVDFSQDGESYWSEPKLTVKLDKPVDDVRKIVFDFIFNQSLTNDGLFKSKAIILNGTTELASANTEAIIGFDQLPNGFVKETVEIPVRGSSVDVIVLSIAGYLTTYKGPVFFDNLRLE
jgi:hypothetical protein